MRFTTGKWRSTPDFNGDYFSFVGSLTIHCRVEHKMVLATGVAPVFGDLEDRCLSVRATLRWSGGAGSHRLPEIHKLGR